MSPEQRRRIVKIIRQEGGGSERVVEDIDIDALIREEVDEDGSIVMKIRIPRSEGGSAQDPLPRAAAVSGAIENLEAEVAELVRRARSQGYTWTQIGDSLGVSKQAAWERFSGED